MRFSHSGALGAPLCPKTIEISDDPNCFIFSMILSTLWCPNKRRKLNLIAIFVLGSDSDCCSTAENKHPPLIKHPSGHKDSVRFSQSLFILPLFCDSVQYLPVGKKEQTKQEMGGGREISPKRSHLSLLEFLIFYTTCFCVKAAQ